MLFQFCYNKCTKNLSERIVYVSKWLIASDVFAVFFASIVSRFAGDIYFLLSKERLLDLLNRKLGLNYIKISSSI
ncbi:hypothetical protein IQ31_02658 [Sphingobacterium siyangense]|uniref:Uncharacterized protein n=1 Tax=Sphingobacterium siyangense TaxID=459529 RepID=A0A562MHC4_9SPHI|nr:hypothetical protein IQ31_02658 [Sphingobacterium siyangense]